VKTALLEVLEPGEKVLGSKTAGSYFVREFVDGEHMGGSFFKSEKEAKDYIKEFVDPEVWKYNKSQEDLFNSED